MRAFIRVAALSLSVAAVGCAAYDVSEARFANLRRSIDEVTGAGGYRCAPRELAIARANLAFADLELAQGDLRRAEQHLVEAEANAGAAFILSPAVRCESAATAAPELARSVDADADDGDDDDDRDGVPNDADRCPALREDLDAHLDADGCPELDNDSDGKLDADDSCPLEPEDRDDFQDGDGCPDRDNDGDGIEDPADECPLESGGQDTRGCPRREYPGLVVAEKELRLTTPIVFERGKATIRSVSFPVLDTVARALADNPRIKIEIGGHTDSQGDPEQNLLRSQEQAEAVQRYLIEHGVEASRLTAKGYGETRPIESNSTSRGRAINRRIELVRTN